MGDQLQNMKSKKQIQTLKIKLVGKLNPTDSTYYGLSLENLVASN
jgi:hypothetical protein